MSAALLMCVSQNDIETPYQFNITGVKVYSFEEALYHAYHYWKESLEDFQSPEFISWVKDALGEKYLASKIEALSGIKEISARLTGFLTLTEYFDGAQLAALNADLSQWEKQLEWERLKDMGDFLMKKGEPQKAYGYYKKALYFGENPQLLNNIGIALMRLELYPESVSYLEKAYSQDKDNLTVILNYSEALIYCQEFERAFKYLKKAERFGEKGIIYYLYGILCVENNNLIESIDYFDKAISMEYDPSYYYTQADVFCRMRRYNKALEIIGNIKDKDEEFYIKQAGIYADYNDYSAAVKSIEKALELSDGKDCYLWTMLAQYYRLGYDLEKAEAAVIKAVTLNSEDKNAKLEQARIKKAQGKTKDYQLVLNRILQSFKREYRKLTEI